MIDSAGLGIRATQVFRLIELRYLFTALMALAFATFFFVAAAQAQRVSHVADDDGQVSHSVLDSARADAAACHPVVDDRGQSALLQHLKHLNIYVQTTTSRGQVQRNLSQPGADIPDSLLPEHITPLVIASVQNSLSPLFQCPQPEVTVISDARPGICISTCKEKMLRSYIDDPDSLTVVVNISVWDKTLANNPANVALLRAQFWRPGCTPQFQTPFAGPQAVVPLNSNEPLSEAEVSAFTKAIEFELHNLINPANAEAFKCLNAPERLH